MNQKLDIVLVEGDSAEAALTIQALRKNNSINSTVHFENGEEALKYIFSSGKYTGGNTDQVPKIILLDLKTSKSGRLEILRRIKSDERIMHIPVILLAYSQDDQDLVEGYMLGADSYIVKPLGFENFFRAISDLRLQWALVAGPSHAKKYV